MLMEKERIWLTKFSMVSSVIASCAAVASSRLSFPSFAASPASIGASSAPMIAAAYSRTRDRMLETRLKP
jgi:hypothetical protein